MKQEKTFDFSDMERSTIRTGIISLVIRLAEEEKLPWATALMISNEAEIKYPYTKNQTNANNS